MNQPGYKKVRGGKAIPAKFDHAEDSGFIFIDTSILVIQKWLEWSQWVFEKHQLLNNNRGFWSSFSFRETTSIWQTSNSTSTIFKLKVVIAFKKQKKN